MSDLLNPYQRNAVTVALRAFEEQLRQFDNWMQGREQVGVLYHRQLSLSESKRALIQGQVAKALKCITELAAQFDLQPQEEDATAMLRAGASACWATLYDVRADKLIRYGQVDPRLAPMLDPSIEALIELALSLALALRSDTEE
jgi:hypothetical protein